MKIFVEKGDKNWYTVIL